MSNEEAIRGTTWRIEPRCPCCGKLRKDHTNYQDNGHKIGFKWPSVSSGTPRAEPGEPPERIWDEHTLSSRGPGNQSLSPCWGAFAHWTEDPDLRAYFEFKLAPYRNVKSPAGARWQGWDEYLMGL